MDPVILSDTPVCIGRGSFAEIYLVSAKLWVFKVVQNPRDADALVQEYEACQTLFHRCNNDSFFATPRALALNVPRGASKDPAVRMPPASPPRGQRSCRGARQIVSEEEFGHFDRAAYALDRVHDLPTATKAYLRQSYFPEGVGTGPSLCRLYFGKEIPLPSKPLRFVNSQNFPLDARRYQALYELYPQDLYPLEKVAEGMGEMLGRIHICASYDGRDVEFVLGGSGYSSFCFWVIDFNQMRKWTKEESDIKKLTSSFFSNDPYYPRPRPNDPLYVAFKTGYRLAVSDHLSPLADAFFTEIEAEQLRRDEKRRTEG